ncbi:MAG: hypothetical protein KDN20_17735 [Verrucomicrobiae bacterium]|nr:hypothetical protein [Verrucomicrobiae bacterium]
MNATDGGMQARLEFEASWQEALAPRSSQWSYALAACRYRSETLSASGTLTVVEGIPLLSALAPGV